VPLLHLFLVHSRGLERGPNWSWADGVDADTLAEELVGKSADETDLPCLGDGVVEEHWWASVCDYNRGQSMYCPGECDEAVSPTQGCGDNNVTTLRDVRDGMLGHEAVCVSGNACRADYEILTRYRTDLSS